jgi:hypothetical protein
MEFNHVQVTTRAPFNRCYLCNDHVGPFIDCFKDQFGYGAVFICAPSYGPNGEMVKPDASARWRRRSAWFIRLR